MSTGAKIGLFISAIFVLTILKQFIGFNIIVIGALILIILSWIPNSSKEAIEEPSNDNADQRKSEPISKSTMFIIGASILISGIAIYYYMSYIVPINSLHTQRVTELRNIFDSNNNQEARQTLLYFFFRSEPEFDLTNKELKDFQLEMLDSLKALDFYQLIDSEKYYKDVVSFKDFYAAFKCKATKVENQSSANDPHPTLANMYNAKGMEKLEQKDYKGALTEFENEILLDPNNAIAYNNRGSAKKHLNDFTGAINDYNKAIKLNPNYAGAYNNRGTVKSRMHSYKDALEDYNMAIKIDPSLADAYCSRGLTNIFLGQRVSACRDFDKASKLGNKLALKAIKDYCH